MAERHLLESADLAEAGPAEAVRLPLELVDSNPNNPRRELAELDALAENIRTFGLLQPVIVRRQGDRYELLGGHRRTAAFALLREREPHDPQWRSIPAVVRTADDDRAFLMLLSSQIHGLAWKPREEAAALERLVLSGLLLKEVGERLQRSEAWVSKRLRVYADSVLSGFVQSGKLPPSVAEELLPLQDLETKKRLAEQAVKEGWTQVQVKIRVRARRLDSRVGKVGTLTRELVDILSALDPQQIPLNMHRDLMVLLGRLQLIAKGGAPRRLPTVAEAEKAAGVRQRDRPLKRGQRRRPGYRPKL